MTARRKYKFDPELVYQHCSDFLHCQRGLGVRPTLKEAYYSVCLKLFAKGLKRIGDIMVLDIPPANELPSLNTFRRIYRQQHLLHGDTSRTIVRRGQRDEGEKQWQQAPEVYMTLKKNTVAQQSVFCPLCGNGEQMSPCTEMARAATGNFRQILDGGVCVYSLWYNSASLQALRAWISTVQVAPNPLDLGTVHVSIPGFSKTVAVPATNYPYANGLSRNEYMTRLREAQTSFAEAKSELRKMLSAAVNEDGRYIIPRPMSVPRKGSQNANATPDVSNSNRTKKGI